MRKKKWVLLLTTIMTTAMAFHAFAGTRDDGSKGQWVQNNVGWWWQAENGTYPTNSWAWLDGNDDGIAECYYFDPIGYMAANTKTPDGYTVNADGAWVENGIVQTKKLTVASGPSHSTSSSSSAGAVTSNVATGWEQDANGWKYKKEDGGYVTDTIRLIDGNQDGVYEIYSFDENGYLYQKTPEKNSNKFGVYDEDGRLETSYYRGGSINDGGPYEVVMENGIWVCVNGTIPINDNGCGKVTGDYTKDAYGVRNLIDYRTLKRDVGLLK